MIIMQSSQESDVDDFPNFPPNTCCVQSERAWQEERDWTARFWTQFGVLSLIVGGTLHSSAS